jgi:Ca-activated chloride channel family protein
MSWGAPWILLGLLLPLCAAGWLWRRRRQAKADGALALLRVNVSGRRLDLGRAAAARAPWLLLLALSLGIVALARPRWGAPRSFAFEQAREVMIALDLSRSMLVEDTPGTRLARAQELMRGLLDRLQGERVGLIVFAGTAYVQVPLSSDYQVVREFLPLLEPDYMPQGGSDYAGMLKAAREGFSQDKETDRYLLVLSDGESTTDGWRDQLGELTKRDVRVLAFALGSEAGGLVPAKDGQEDAPVVFSKLKPATLRALAAGTGGLYEQVSAQTDLGALLAVTVEQGRKGRYERKLGEARPERFQWLLVPAAFCALAGLWREIAVRPRLRQALPVVPAGVARAALWLVAAAGVVGGVVTGRAHDEHGDEKVSFTVAVEGTAAQRLLALVEHLARNGYDTGDVRLMAEETINYGIEAQTRGLLLQPGAIHDAIRATADAKRLDPAAANWDYLQARLAKLLEPPADAAGSEAVKKDDLEAMDEEDKPLDTAGRATQQMTSDGGGRGGPGKSDATLGELKKGITQSGKKPDVKPVVIRPQTGTPAYEAEQGPVNSVRSLSLRSWREAIKDDSPGKVHQALQGKSGTKAEGDRDY